MSEVISNCTCGKPDCFWCIGQREWDGVGKITFTPYTVGWTCPGCGSHYGPGVVECLKCNKVVVT